MKVKEVIVLLRDSDEYKKFSELFRKITEGRSRFIEENEAKALSDAAGKLTEKFVEMMKPTISSVISCSKVHGNEALSKMKTRRRINEIKKAVRFRCKLMMPDYYLFLDRKLVDLWILKHKKKNKKRSP